MQGAYYEEAMGMKSLKMEAISRCKRRTKLYGRPISASPSSPNSAVIGNSRAFTTNASSVQRLH